MSKIYLSRSMTRTMSADHPVGDPTGGAAYGEKNDPITIVLSVASMSASYGAMMAGSIMAGITFTGAALSLVGSVTGNKTLTKIGMVAGIAGGLGQMGAFGETAKNATWGSTFGNSATPPVTSSTASLSQTPKTTVAGNQNVNAAYGQTTVANSPSMTPDGLPGVTGQANIANSPVATANANMVSTNAAASPVVANTPPASQSLWDKTVSGGMEMGKDAWSGIKAAGSSVMDFTKANPYGAMAIGQIAQPIADYLSGKTDAEIEALDAQTGYATAKEKEIKEAIAREKRRRENLNAGYREVDAGINVNAGALNQAQAGGLISGAMQPTA